MGRGRGVEGEGGLKGKGEMRREAQRYKAIAQCHRGTEAHRNKKRERER